jgi:hypothetical protein
MPSASQGFVTNPSQPRAIARVSVLARLNPVQTTTGMSRVRGSSFRRARALRPCGLHGAGEDLATVVVVIGDEHPR